MCLHTPYIVKIRIKHAENLLLHQNSTTQFLLPLPENISLRATKFAKVNGCYVLHRMVRIMNIATLLRGILLSVTSATPAIICLEKKYQWFSIDILRMEKRRSQKLPNAQSTMIFCSLTRIQVIFEESTIVKLPQKNFPAGNHKRWLIALIRSTFQSLGIKTKQAVEDTGCDIVNMAQNKHTPFQSVLLIGEHVDLLVLLNKLGSAVNNVFYLKKKGLYYLRGVGVTFQGHQHQCWSAVKVHEEVSLSLSFSVAPLYNHPCAFNKTRY